MKFKTRLACITRVIAENIVDGTPLDRRVNRTDSIGIELIIRQTLLATTFIRTHSGLAIGAYLAQCVLEHEDEYY